MSTCARARAARRRRWSSSSQSRVASADGPPFRRMCHAFCEAVSGGIRRQNAPPLQALTRRIARDADRRRADDMPVVLDCTLRDGGFYTRWDFDRALVAAYLRAMAAARV